MCRAEGENHAEATGGDRRSICSFGWTCLQLGVLSSGPEINQQLWCARVWEHDKYPSSQHSKSNDGRIQSNEPGRKTGILIHIPKLHSSSTAGLL